MSNITETVQPAVPGTQRDAARPVTATVAAVLQLALGTITSVAGCAFSTIAGGGWYIGSFAFPLALVLWWVAGVGLLRGSWAAHRLGIVMLVALCAFNLMKILRYHEGAGYLFMSLTIVVAAFQLAAPTRAWVRR